MERAGNAAILPADPLITDHWSPFSRRGGRAVECAGIENRKAERPREFESHPLRASSVVLPVNFPDNDFMGEQNEDYEPRFDWRARSRRITSEALTLRPAKHLRRPEVRATVGRFA